MNKENNKITLINEEFENELTGEKVQGVTIIIDGKIKLIMDDILNKSPFLNSYVDLLKEVLIKGINAIIEGNKM